MTPEDLINFEKEIEHAFADGAIKAPVHLAGGNERQLIEIFKDIAPHDWVLCNWRSHFHALLRGVPPRQVKAAIIGGHSIAMCFPEYKFLSSALVGGICPIAVGLGWAIKDRKGRPERVHCFVGDMTARTGIFDECIRYCRGHGLPVHFIVEDNGKSVMTDTLEVWGTPKPGTTVEMYQYEMSKPHVGTGRWVSF